MPIYDIICNECGKTSEVLLYNKTDEIKCLKCNSTNVEKLMSATSNVSGKSSSTSVVDPNSTCCGNPPDQLSCEGPGSCCGRPMYP